MLTGKVSCFDKDLSELFVGKHSGLFEAIHGSSDFHVNVSVNCNNVVEVILVGDIFGDVR